jgi:hypothetical protein
MLVIVLVSSCLGWIGMKSMEAIRVARFDRGVREVASRLQLAQLLMVAHACDVTIHLESREGELHLYLEGEISPRYRQLVGRWKPLPEFESISWNGERYPTIAIPMRAGRSNCYATGVLGVCSRKGEERFLLLEGYPKYPRIFAKQPSLPPKQRPPYPEELALAAQ